MKRLAASALAAAVAVSGLTIGTVAAPAQAAEPVAVEGATLEWGYSIWAQTAMTGVWEMSA